MRVGIVSRRMFAVGCLLVCGVLPSCAQFRRTEAVQRTTTPSPVEADLEAAVAEIAVDFERPTIQQAGYQAVEENAKRDDATGNLVPAAPTELISTALTLDDVERMAMEFNPTLAQAEANIAVADGRWIQAGLYPNPTAGYQGNEIGNNGQAGQQGVFVSQEIVTANKLALSQHAAAHEVGRRQSQRSAQQLRVLTSVRVAFYDALVAQATVITAKELRDVSDEGVKTTKLLKKAQKVSEVDVLQAQVELNKAEILLTKARNRKQAAWKQLRSLIGKSDLAATSVEGDLQPPSEKPNAAMLLQQILAESPEMAAAQQDVARAHAALQRAEAQPIPNVTVQAGMQYDFSTHDPVVNLQLSLPIPKRNRNQGNIHAAESEWVAASRELERRELAIRHRFASAYERYANASVELKQYTMTLKLDGKSGIIEDVETSKDLIKKVFEAGETSYLRWLTAQRSYSEAKVRQLEVAREWWAAKLEIDGLLLKGGLQNPGD